MFVDFGSFTWSEDLDEREDKVEEISEEELKILKEKIDSFTNNILPACLSLLDAIPSTVHAICDLINAVGQRNGRAWRLSMFLDFLE